MANLDALKSALLGVTQKCYHFGPPQDVSGAYIVWAEDGEAEMVWANNKRRMAAIAGTIDYFTKDQDDPNVRKIEEALQSLRIGWRLNSVQFETDTRYIHYEWRWEMI